MNTLLIGGPHDGRRVSLPFPLLELKTVVDDKLKAQGISTEYYHEVFPNVPVPMRLFRHSSITDEQAVQMLFDGYKTA